MSTKQVDITADIKIRHVFKCSECEKEQMGETRTHKFKGYDTSTMDAVINKSTTDPNYMPIGWHCYLKGRTLMYCCGCKQKYDEK